MVALEPEPDLWGTENLPSTDMWLDRDETISQHYSVRYSSGISRSGAPFGTLLMLLTARNSPLLTLKILGGSRMEICGRTVQGLGKAAF
jgi:hypothetical protein